MKVRLTDDDVREAVIKMTRYLSVGITRVIGVARGGLIPAAMLAHQLNVRRVEAINIYARNHDGTALEFPVVQGFPPADDNPRTVIVEDIVDTGRTLDTLRRYYPTLNVLALVSRSPRVPGMISVPPYAWVQFPWELD